MQVFDDSDQPSAFQKPYPSQKTQDDYMFSRMTKQDTNSDPESTKRQLRSQCLYDRNIPITELFHSDPSEELSLSSEHINAFLAKYEPYDRKLIQSKRSNFQMLKIGVDKYYIGEMFNGKCHGVGIVVFKDGRLYEGSLENNLRQGDGLFVQADRSWYFGEYSNDKKDGYGLEITKNSNYQGNYVSGMRHGMGMLVSRGVTFNGEWRIGVIHGYGVLDTDQSRYEGNFMNNLKNGQGREIFRNGDQFVGLYSNGKPEGQGQYRWKAEGCLFKGSFINGQRYGKGMWTNSTGDKYLGHYKEDLKSGYGQFYWKSGNFYKGNFLQDLREGYGQMFWNDGCVYKGQWHKGVQHGKGQLYVPGKQTMIGIFDQNVLVSHLHQFQNISMMDLSERKRTKLQPVSRKRITSLKQIMPIQFKKTPIRSRPANFNPKSNSYSRSPKQLLSKSKSRSRQRPQLHDDHSPGSHHRCKACATKAFNSQIDIRKAKPPAPISKTFNVRQGNKSAAMKQFMRNQAAQYLKYKF